MLSIGFDGEHAPQVSAELAPALDAIATSEALISKAIRTQVLSTDGPKTADALRKHAATLRAEADRDDELAAVQYARGVARAALRGVDPVRRARGGA